MKNLNPNSDASLIPLALGDASISLQPTTSSFSSPTRLPPTSSPTERSSFHSLLLVLQCDSSLIQPHAHCSKDCLQSTQGVILSQETENFTHKVGDNLLEMVNDPNKNSETANDKENQHTLNSSTPKQKSPHENVPCEGMEFASLEKFEEFYYAYAKSKGYTVRIKKTLRVDQTYIPRYRHYVCSCAGFSNEKKPVDEADSDEEKVDRRTLTRRSGCLVAVTVSKK